MRERERDELSTVIADGLTDGHTSTADLASCIWWYEKQSTAQYYVKISLHGIKLYNGIE